MSKDYMQLEIEKGRRCKDCIHIYKKCRYYPRCNFSFNDPIVAKIFYYYERKWYKFWRPK